MLPSKHKRLYQFWISVVEGGLSINCHWLKVFCLLGISKHYHYYVVPSELMGLIRHSNEWQIWPVSFDMLVWFLFIWMIGMSFNMSISMFLSIWSVFTVIRISSCYAFLISLPQHRLGQNSLKDLVHSNACWVYIITRWRYVLVEHEALLWPPPVTTVKSPQIFFQTNIMFPPPNVGTLGGNGRQLIMFHSSQV